MLDEVVIERVQLSSGTKAPDFTGKIYEEKEFTLSENRGKNVVLYFYPQDNTPGCTMQAISLRDKMDKIKELDAIVVGVSCDPQEKHKKFCNYYNLPFPLISDESQEISRKYGVLKHKKLFTREYLGIERSTFIIDKEGTIRHAWYNVAVFRHADNVISALSRM